MYRHSDMYHCANSCFFNTMVYMGRLLRVQERKRESMGRTTL
nr:MAG TPA: hypothetical protein [Caudoviricetes sp.]